MAAGDRDPYAVLGVVRSATNAEIRAAYRALVAQYHPDRHQGNPLEGLAAERMAEINQAYELLSDPARRAAFDGRPGSGPAAARGGPASRRQLRWVFVVIGVLLLARIGAMVLRATIGLGRGLFEELAALRGTPILLAAAGLVVVILVRRRRRR